MKHDSCTTINGPSNHQVTDKCIDSIRSQSSKHLPHQHYLRRAAHLSQKLHIPALAPSPPTLPPDHHGHRHDHGPDNQKTIKRKRPAVIGGIDKMLDGERDGKVDHGRAARQHDNQLSGNLHETLASQHHNFSGKGRTRSKHSMAYAVAILVADTCCAIMQHSPTAMDIQWSPFCAPQP